MFIEQRYDLTCSALTTFNQKLKNSCFIVFVNAFLKTFYSIAIVYLLSFHLLERFLTFSKLSNFILNAV